MKEKYEIIQHSKGYEIRKKEKIDYTVKELKEILDGLIKQGKGEYSVLHEGFCCGACCIDVMTSAKQISID